ncbi:MarR family winged helix-turn-helix transcriptional regulator [Tropicimonas marinistellae]|uniref:MarR family winged helix-turn-helix transcriptional regulator n=1 Tax=Tropicimonas marinistellae TaxID=1739787 RepID=UPI00082A170B|nr:MarR family transcriptional regulator [Tropicimonas marinistellae]
MPPNLPTCDDDVFTPPELRIIFGNLLLTRQIEARMDDFNTSAQLSKQERHLLIKLGVPRRMGQMAEDLNMQPSGITACADLLEAKGYLVRERDPDDRRAWQIRLTDEGASAREELISVIVAQFRKVTGLSEAEIDKMADVFDAVTEHILQSGFSKGLTI